VKRRASRSHAKGMTRKVQADIARICQWQTGTLWSEDTNSFTIHKCGEVSEWLKVLVSKTGVRGNSYRGFESLPLRQDNRTRPCAWSYYLAEVDAFEPSVQRASDANRRFGHQALRAGVYSEHNVQMHDVIPPSPRVDRPTHLTDNRICIYIVIVTRLESSKEGHNMPTVILGIGIPGSGKTTALKALVAGTDTVYVCPDDIRNRLTGDTSDQSRNREVWDLAYQQIHEALDAGRNVALDATNAYKRVIGTFVVVFNPLSLCY
jgi:hypothetical protein